MKTVRILFLGLLLSVGLSACQMPITGKQFTMPLLEKEPVEALSLMNKAMSEKVNSHKEDGSVDIIIKMPDFKKAAEEKAAEAERKRSLATTTSNDYYGLTYESYNPILMMAAMIPGMIKINGQSIFTEVKNNGRTADVEGDAKLSVDLGNMVYSGDFSTKMIGDKSFVMLKSLPSIIEKAIDSSMMNQWIKMDDISGLEDVGDVGPVPGLMANNGSSTEEIKKDIEDKKKKVEEIFYKFEKEVDAMGIFVFIERLPDEKIDGVNCYHYKTSMNLEVFDKIKSAAAEIGALTGQDDENLGKFHEKIAKLKESLIDNNGEIWFGKKDFYLRQVDVDIKFDIAKVVGAEEYNKYGEMTVEIRNKYKLSSFNQTSQITEPEDAKTIKEIIESSPALNSARMKSRNARRLADIKQVQTAAELYYNDEGEYPDKIVFDGKSGITGSSSPNTYMSLVPNNPKPNDGDCPVDFEYQYQVSADGQGYDLKYCLGDIAGGIPAGIRNATPFGTNTSSYNEENAKFNERVASSSAQEQSFQLTDSDKDDLPDMYEEIYGTNPNKADTDGDGYLDGAEVKGGYDPNGPGKLQ
jgi:hypothetical protein